MCRDASPPPCIERTSQGRCAPLALSLVSNVRKHRRAFAALASAWVVATAPLLAEARTHPCVDEGRVARRHHHGCGPGTAAAAKSQTWRGQRPAVKHPHPAEANQAVPSAPDRGSDSASAAAEPTRTDGATLQRLRIKSCQRHPETCAQGPSRGGEGSPPTLPK